MLNVYINLQPSVLHTQIKLWLHELSSSNVHYTQSIEHAQLYITEINELFDWIAIRRLKRKYPKCIIIPILPEALAYSASIAIDMQLAYLLIEPLQKHKFLRAARKIYLSFQQSQLHEAFDYVDLSIEMKEAGSLYYDTLLRSIIRNEIKTESDFLDASSAISMTQFPNTVLFFQSFSLNDCVTKKNCQLVYQALGEHFGQHELHFLPFDNRLIILTYVPVEHHAFKSWAFGTTALSNAIEQLKQQQIYSYVGVGQTVSHPLDLHHSYSQARLARRKPPADSIHIRYSEELPQHESVQRAIQLIEEQCHEPINIVKISKEIGFSATYFGKLFKKETGLSFPEYVSYTRIIQTLIPLRRTTQTLEQISADYGFNTPNYFSGTFKKYVTLSPSDYRQTTEVLFK